jgi:hypothetical protein
MLSEATALEAIASKERAQSAIGFATAPNRDRLSMDNIKFCLLLKVKPSC